MKIVNEVTKILCLLVLVAGTAIVSQASMRYIELSVAPDVEYDLYSVGRPKPAIHHEQPTVIAAVNGLVNSR